MIHCLRTRPLPRILPYMLAFSLPLLTLACNGEPPAPDADIYEVHGQIVEIIHDGQAAVIDHEEIPGYMGAMRMTFRAGDASELEGLQPGDSVTFQYVVISPTNSYIENVEVTTREAE